MGVLNKLFGRFLLKSDPSATTQTTAVIQATDTNSSIAIVPNGTGAITGHIPDGTTAGGNSRGSYSVDFQRLRFNANEVASSIYSVIVGGRGNRSAASYSFIGGGRQNIATSEHCIVVGGESNTASTNTYATVVGGYQNSSTGQYSVSGGGNCTASGQYATAFGGFTTASGNYSIAHSYAGSVAGVESAGFGSRVRGYLNNCFTFGGNRFSNQGDRQFHELLRFGSPTLTTGATSTITTNLIPWNTNTVWNVTIKYTAVVTSITGTATGVSVGDCKNEVLTIGFKRIGGTSSVVGSLNTLSTNEDSSMSTASFGVTAGSSQEMKLDFTAPTFTGGGSVTTRVVAKVELTEVAY